MQTTIKDALERSLYRHNNKAKVYHALRCLTRGLETLNRKTDALRVYNLWYKLFRSNNNPALRAWALKARRVIGEIES